MNTKEYRFTEIVSAISLLPEAEDKIDESMLKLPNGTDGLDESLYKALMTQSMHESDGWRARLFTALLATTMNAVMDRGKILEQDLWGFTIAANVAWASQAGTSAMKALGLLAHTAEQAEMEVPNYAFHFFKNPNDAKVLSNQDPYAFLGGE